MLSGINNNLPLFANVVPFGVQILYYYYCYYYYCSCYDDGRGEAKERSWLPPSLCLHPAQSFLAQCLPAGWVVYIPSPEQLLLSGGCKGAWRLPFPMRAHPHCPGVAWTGQGDGGRWGNPWLLGWSCSLLLTDPCSSTGADREAEEGRGSRGEGWEPG